MPDKKTKETPSRFVSTLEESKNRLWSCHLRVPVRIALDLMRGTNKRVICSINGSDEFQCALRHRGKNLYLVTVNQKLRKHLELDFGDRVCVALRKDESRYGHAVPEELLAVFRNDREGRKRFDALVIGKQRTLLYIINAVKSSEKRLFRAVAIVEHLKSNGGQINYRLLSEAMKDPRRSR